MQPEYVRGALFASHAHGWELQNGRAYVGELGYTVIRHSIVWKKRRRIER